MNKNILVVGDIMLDRYIIGDVSRISPEAPVPIVKETRRLNYPGGCGNVIRNISHLKCNVYCKTIIGDDYVGSCLLHKLNELHNFHDVFIVKSISYPTTLKSRVISEYRMTQLLRIDREVTSPKILFSKDEIKLINDLNIDLIIISDYNKGVITQDLMDQIRILNIPFIVDPKPHNINLYNDAFAITPNNDEYHEIINTQTPILCKYIVRTMGDKGIKIINTEDLSVNHIKTSPVEVFNVSGAGDTVIAILGYCIAHGNDMVTSCQIANECAHYVVTKPGTTIVPIELFERIYLEYGGI